MWRVCQGDAVLAFAASYRAACQSLATLEAETFIQRLLVGCLRVKHLIVGDDFRFGAGRRGDFAMLKTIRLTEPVVSGQQFGKILGEMVMQLSGGSVIMQRVGDFRMGARSKAETFNNDLYDFEPTLKNAVAGDLSLCMPAKILRDIWKALKMLDTIIPGVLHPSTIIYYPEIKTMQVHRVAHH